MEESASDKEESAEAQTDVFDFLQARGCNVEKLKQENIDENVIRNIIDDKELSSYIPRYGDRCALKDFLNRPMSKVKQRNHLFEKLKLKLNSGRSTTNSSKSKGVIKSIQNRNAVRLTRKIEMGWLNFCHSTGNFKQVKSKTGGGTRSIHMRKLSTSKDILIRGKQLFFPKGCSPLGKESGFTFKVMNYCERELPTGVTIEQLYEETGMNILRFYLFSKSNICEELPDLPGENEANIQQITSSISEITQTASDLDDVLNANIQQITSSISEITQTASDLDDVLNANIQQITSSIYEDTKNASTLQTESVTNLQIVASEIGKQTVSTSSSQIKSSDMGENTEGSDIAQSQIIIDDTSIPLNTVENIISETDDLEETLPYSQEFLGLAENKMEKRIRINRGNVLMDMITKFSSVNPFYDKITVEMVLPNGETEIGEDSGGVLRDCLTQFWSDFYSQCSIGNNYKLPFLRHDYGKPEWESVAKIIYLGWNQVNYFPISIAPSIFELCVIGNVKSDLRHIFFEIISKSEAELLKMALVDIGAIDMEELVDIMDLHQCRTIPKQDNIHRIINEIAHKEIIQETSYIIETWKPILSNLVINLDETYSNSIPTTQKVLKCITTDQNSLLPNEEDVLKHLRKYVRSCDCTVLKKFLRFCTGADIMIGQEIKVTFNRLIGLQRRPVAHTCGCVLEISTEYENYPTFKTEFDSVLSSDIWVMDIV